MSSARKRSALHKAQAETEHMRQKFLLEQRYRAVWEAAAHKLGAAVEEQRATLNKITTTPLLDLLAVIHRDGGHHTSEVGIPQSVEDALQVIHKMRDALEKIADWNSAWGPFPETKKDWCSMAIVTAREACAKVCRDFGKTLEVDVGDCFAEEIMARSHRPQTGEK